MTEGHESQVKGTVHLMSDTPSLRCFGKSNGSVSEGKVGELCVLLLAFPQKPPGPRPNKYLM